jgi:hypothetical protein
MSLLDDNLIENIDESVKNSLKITKYYYLSLGVPKDIKPIIDPISLDRVKQLSNNEKAYCPISTPLGMLHNAPKVLEYVSKIILDLNLIDLENIRNNKYILLDIVNKWYKKTYLENHHMMVDISIRDMHKTYEFFPQGETYTFNIRCIEDPQNNFTVTLTRIK